MSDTPKSATSDTADAVDKASHHSHYRLRVTAGPAYDPSTHKVVPVNAPETLTFENDHIIVSLTVRLRKFTGFPSSSPETADYFQHPLHKSDQYSISFSFIPKVDIPGKDLVFGNDFDRPIRDRLPPGFSQAFRIVKWWIDPGLDGDVYADKPYLYGPALSSWNILKICDRVIDTDKVDNHDKWEVPNAATFHGEVVEEGGEGSGEDVRSEEHIPADSAARKKYFLTKAHLEAFTFEKGRLYQSDFSNPYLDFNEFSLKLPGFTMNIIGYIDSKSHELRYTLKNLATDEVYCVIVFTLLFGEELAHYEKEEGSNAPQPTAKETEEATKKGIEVEDSAPADDDLD